MWNIGSAHSITSAGVVCATERHVRCMNRRLPCVSITPLGRPVVPDVYISAATSGYATSGHACSATGTRETAVAWPPSSTSVSHNPISMPALAAALRTSASLFASTIAARGVAWPRI